MRVVEERAPTPEEKLDLSNAPFAMKRFTHVLGQKGDVMPRAKDVFVFGIINGSKERSNQLTDAQLRALPKGTNPLKPKNTRYLSIFTPGGPIMVQGDAELFPESFEALSVFVFGPPHIRWPIFDNSIFLQVSILAWRKRTGRRQLLSLRTRSLSSAIDNSRERDTVLL